MSLTQRGFCSTVSRDVWFASSTSAWRLRTARSALCLEPCSLACRCHSIASGFPTEAPLFPLPRHSRPAYLMCWMPCKWKPWAMRPLQSGLLRYEVPRVLVHLPPMLALQLPASLKWICSWPSATCDLSPACCDYIRRLPSFSFPKRTSLCPGACILLSRSCGTCWVSRWTPPCGWTR